MGCIGEYTGRYTRSRNRLSFCPTGVLGQASVVYDDHAAARVAADRDWLSVASAICERWMVGTRAIGIRFGYSIELEGGRDRMFRDVVSDFRADRPGRF